MDHGRTDVAMPQQFLDRPDVAAVLEQVGSERVAQRVTGRALRYSRVPDGLLEGSLDDRLVKMMPTALAGHSVDVEASGGKHPLPDPLPACVRILACQCPRKLNPAGSLPEIDIMLLLRGFRWRVSSALMMDGSVVVRSLSPLPPRTVIMALEVDILYREASALEQAQAGPVHQDGHKARGAAKLTENRPYLGASEHDRQSHRPLGSDYIVQPGHILFEHFPVEEEQGAQRLVLGRRRDVSVDGQRAQESRQLRRAHLGRVTLAMKQDVASGPRDVGLFRPSAVVTGTHGVADPVEESWGLRRQRRWLSRGKRGSRGRVCQNTGDFTHRLVSSLVR